MTDIPDDLVALPTMPYVERPNELPLDTEECRTALWMTRGNVTEAAQVLKVTSKRLRTFIKNSHYLISEMQEATEQLLDIAEKNIYNALTDEDDASRRDTMSRYVLSNQGKARGWGTQGSSLSVKNAAGGTIVVQWADGTAIKPEPKTIDGEHDINEDRETNAA